MAKQPSQARVRRREKEYQQRCCPRQRQFQQHEDHHHRCAGQHDFVVIRRWGMGFQGVA